MSETSKCRSCGAEIRWCRTEQGKLMPLDFAPHPQGEWSIDTDGMCHHEKGGALPFQDFYRAHWAACPHSAQHRKANLA